jgi:dolichyl-phosphate beta-glucosyltransferase
MAASTMTHMPKRTEPPRAVAAVGLSVVVPAYNEIHRLPAFLASSRPYLDALEFDYEVVVVDDGSSDDTLAFASDLAAVWPEVRVLSNGVNRGKGAAVRLGVLGARGAHVLFCDADGATPIADEARLRRALDAGWDVAIGSRAVRDRGAQCVRAPARLVASRAFAAVARLALGMPYRDTQCGFKMFARAAAQRVFRACREDRFLFDLEILLLARRFGLRVKEVAVNWREQPGSTIDLRREVPRMLLGLARLRRGLGVGRSVAPLSNDGAEVATKRP